MNSRISDTRSARKNIFLCEEGDARVAYFVAGNFTRAGIFCSFYYPREKWGTSQSRPVKQTNQRTNQSSNYVCSCRRTGAKRGKKSRQCHNLTSDWWRLLRKTCTLDWKLLYREKIYSPLTSYAVPSPLTLCATASSPEGREWSRVRDRKMYCWT